jgi:hypothetical protein
VEPIHLATQWSHEIVSVLDCPENAAGVAGCADGAAPTRFDPWATAPAGSSCEDFGHPAACPIPGGFFGPGSDPFLDIVCFDGVPLGMVSIPGFPTPLDFGETDTVVMREIDPFDRCALPPSDPDEEAVTVPIEVYALRLHSQDPIVVTYNGGQSAEEWDVTVELSTSEMQPGGGLTARKTHCNGGTFNSVLAACPKFIFNRLTGTPLQLALDYCVACNDNGITMTSQNIPWTHDADTLLGVVSPVCTTFHPGVVDLEPTTECDCNGNNTRDTCDIENGTSLDTNGNGVPDECDVLPCPSDRDGSGVVDVADMILVILGWGPCTKSCMGDVNGDAVVDVQDLTQVVLEWGPC